MSTHVCLSLLIRLSVQSCASPEGPIAVRPPRLDTNASALDTQHWIVRLLHEGGKFWGPLSTSRTLVTARASWFPALTRLRPVLDPMAHAPLASYLVRLEYRTLVYPDLFVHLPLPEPTCLACHLFSWNGPEGSWSTIASPWTCASSWNLKVADELLK